MSDEHEHGLRGRLVVATRMCAAHEEEIKHVHAEASRLRASLEMALDRIAELERYRERLIAAIDRVLEEQK